MLSTYAILFMLTLSCSSPSGSKRRVSGGERRVLSLTHSPSTSLHHSLVPVYTPTPRPARPLLQIHSSAQPLPPRTFSRCCCVSRLLTLAYSPRQSVLVILITPVQPRHTATPLPSPPIPPTQYNSISASIPLRLVSFNQAKLHSRPVLSISVLLYYAPSVPSRYTP